MSLIHQHRGAPNRLSFVVQLCYLSFLDLLLGLKQGLLLSLLALVGTQLMLSAAQRSAAYGQCPSPTPWQEHLLEPASCAGLLDLYDDL